METSLLYILKAFILPPGIHILLICGGILCLKKYRKTGKFLIASSLVTLYLLSTLAVSRHLASLLETTPALSHAQLVNPTEQAIVILGGGRLAKMPEYGKPVPKSHVLERLRYAAKLHRQTRLPILISGGRVFPKSDSEAMIMNDVLQDDFAINATWLEENSRNTAQNAQHSFTMLSHESIRKIFLVTHATHMHRSKKIFSDAGFDVTPAPTIYYSAGTNLPIVMQWLPLASALELSRSVIHEMIGIQWYKVRYKNE